jgi:hypothetical protein
MSAARIPLGLASEGTFGPHPIIPFLNGGMELLMFVDDERCITVSESLVAEATNDDHLVVAPNEATDHSFSASAFRRMRSSSGRTSAHRILRLPRASSIQSGSRAQSKKRPPSHLTTGRGLRPTCAPTSIRPG